MPPCPKIGRFRRTKPAGALLSAPLDFVAVCRYVDGMDDVRGLANMVCGEAAAMPFFDAFWFSFSYYACPALLEGGEST